MLYFEKKEISLLKAFVKYFCLFQKLLIFAIGNHSKDAKRNLFWKPD